MLGQGSLWVQAVHEIDSASSKSLEGNTRETRLKVYKVSKQLTYNTEMFMLASIKVLD